MSTQLGTVVADFQTALATKINVGDTTATLQSATDDDGVALPTGRYFFTVDRDNGRREHFSCQLTSTALTDLKSISRQGVETTGAARLHKIGAKVTLTDFAHIRYLADILRGTGTLDGTTPLSYDTAPTLTDPKQVATVAYVLSVVNGGAVSFSSQTISATAGESLVAGNIVYFKESDQRWWKADADLSATFDQVQLGVAQGTAAGGAGVTILLSGLAANFSGLSAGTKYFLSNTAGAVVTSGGTNTVFLGVAVNTTTIKFTPQEIYWPTKLEKDFLTNYTALTGIVIPYAGSAAPTGFLLCDGSAVSRTTYAALFAVTSTTYGVGNGSTTFNLPDLRSRSVLGAGTAPTKVATFASRSSNVITVTGLSNAANNEFQTGQAVLYAAPSGAMTGLTDNTTYYVVRVSNLTFSLATSLANAQNGTVISLSSDGTGTQTFTLTLTARTAGTTGGEENHAMSVTELLAHTHGATGTFNSGSVALSSTNDAASANPSSKGGNAAMNVMNPFLVLNYIIKI